MALGTPDFIICTAERGEPGVAAGRVAMATGATAAGIDWSRNSVRAPGSPGVVGLDTGSAGFVHHALPGLCAHRPIDPQ